MCLNRNDIQVNTTSCRISHPEQKHLVRFSLLAAYLEEEYLNIQKYASCWSPVTSAAIPSGLGAVWSSILANFLVHVPFSCFHFFVFASLLSVKCNLAKRGRGARFCWSNPLTQTNPEMKYQNVNRHYKFDNWYFVAAYGNYTYCKVCNGTCDVFTFQGTIGRLV